MPKLTHFDYIADEKTGLSAVYDAAKMKIEEVNFNFRKYKLVMVYKLPVEAHLKPNEVYVKQSDKGLELALCDTDDKPAAPSCFAFDKLDLPTNFQLTDEAFDQKHSQDKDAKTLKENILKELFTLGFVIQPFNLKIYKITPEDSNQKPFLVALNHAKSGSNAKKDGPPRARERKEINRISKVLQKQHAECTHFVWGGDSNEAAYLLKEGVKIAKNENDLKINIDGLSNESKEIGGDNLVLTQLALPDFAIGKSRMVGVRGNAQSDKGGEEGNDAISAKAILMVLEFQKPNENNKNANAEATARILKEQTVPKGEVRPLHSGKTLGSDHAKTGIVQVNGIAIDVQPLIETRGPRGFRSYDLVYKKPHDEASIKIEHTSALKLTELILLEMGKTPEEIKLLDFKAREKIIHPNKQAKDYIPNNLVEKISKNWQEQTPAPKLYAVLKAWIESPEQKAANELLSQKPEIATETDIKKIFTEYLKKQDGRIIDAIFRTEKTELSGGFTYLANPRRDQLASYDNMVGKVDLRLAAGDGPKNHAEKEHPEHYATEMLNVCTRLDKLNQRRADFKTAAYTAVGVILGACIGAAAALAIGLVAPIVLGVAMGSAGLLGLVALAYASYKPTAAKPAIANTLETSKPAPLQTASPVPKEGQAFNPAMTFSKGTVLTASNDLDGNRRLSTFR